MRWPVVLCFPPAYIAWLTRTKAAFTALSIHYLEKKHCTTLNGAMAAALPSIRRLAARIEEWHEEHLRRLTKQSQLAAQLSFYAQLFETKCAPGLNDADALHAAFSTGHPLD